MFVIDCYGLYRRLAMVWHACALPKSHVRINVIFWDPRDAQIHHQRVPATVNTKQRDEDADRDRYYDTGSHLYYMMLICEYVHVYAHT